MVTYDVKQTLTLIRGTLKEAFPGIRFSVVRSRTGYANNCVIKWSEGPGIADVRAKLDVFQTADYNLNNDDGVTYRGPVEYKGELCKFSIDFISYHKWKYKEDKTATPVSNSDIAMLLYFYEKTADPRNWTGYRQWEHFHRVEASKLETLLRVRKKADKAVIGFISKLGDQKVTGNI